MSETENEMDTNTGIKIPRFHGRRGEDYGLWRHRLRAACRIKGVWRVVDISPAFSDSSNIQTGTEIADPRTLTKREKASGIIISALGDAPLRVVMEVDDDPQRMLQLLDARYASNRTVSRIAVQTQLFRMKYTNQDMSSYVDQYTTLFSQLERMGKDAAIPETHKAPMLLASIDPSCRLESTAAALRTKDVTELTWDYVATTMIDEYNAKQFVSSESGGKSGRNRRKRNKRGSYTSSRITQNDNDESDNSDIESKVRALTVALKSVKSGNSKIQLHCNFCDKSGHTEDRCYLNPDNPNNKLPPKVCDRFISNASKKESGNAGHGKNVEIAGTLLQKATVLPPRDNRSYADSGATAHFFHSQSLFVPGSMKECDPTTVLLADKTPVSSTECGDVIIPFRDANIRLRNTFYVPGLGYNLVSMGRLADNGIESHFRRDDVQLMLESDGFVIGTGERDNDTRLYMLPEPISHDASQHAMVTEKAKDEAQTQLWHQRLAHINGRDLMKVHVHADGVPKLCPMEEVCRACRLGKAHKLPFPSQFRQASRVGELVHSDIVGPLEPSFPDRFRYVSTFLDGHSRYLLIGCMNRRSMLKEVFDQVSVKFRKIGGAKSETNIGFTGITKLHSDGAKEYVALQNDLGGVDGDKSFSPPHTPELNGIAERVNRTMVEAALALLIQANLPRCLWPFALKHVVYVRNRVPHSSIGVTPFLVMTGEKPSLKNIRVFGCTAYVLRLPRGSKFESRALEGVYLETLEHGIYRVLIIDDDGIPRMVESRHVTFDESKFPGAPELVEYMDDEDASDDKYSFKSESESEYESESNEDDEDALSIDDFYDVGDDESENDTPDVAEDAPEHNDEDSSDSGSDFNGGNNDDQTDEQNTSDGNNRRYPDRHRKPPDWYVASSAQVQTIDVKVTTSDEPTLREALSGTSEEKSLWQSALDTEFESLEFKHTWVRDDNPRTQPLPTHPVLKVKRKSDGTVERFKARIVAGGNFQKYGEDYLETYAPVVSFSIVRIFLYLVLCLGMYVAQVDVKTAFLNGDLAENVWVMSPRGIPGRKSLCYKLLKAIYGLKQAHLAWHRKLCSDLQDIGFKELENAPCVFRRKCKSGTYQFILVYVDDLLILAPSIMERDSIVTELKNLYELRVVDEVDLFLGVQLGWELDSEGKSVSLNMSQPLYVESILRRFGLQDSKPACTPMVESFFTGLSSEKDKSVVLTERYQQMIGSLLYLALRTRLDILAPVLILARFQKSPTAYCHRGVKRILRYLRGTHNYRVRYHSGSLKIQAYVDADYAGDVVDRKSMSGFLIKLGDATCVWGSKKQATVALSTCESEYYAMTLAAKETIWIARVLKEVGLESSQDVVLRSDNQSAIKWATGERCPSGRAKHIDVRVHFIRELISKSILNVDYVASEENDADILTKPLGPKLFMDILGRLGLGGATEEEC